MKRRILLGTLALLLAISLGLISCAKPAPSPAPAPTPEPAPAPAPEPEKPIELDWVSFLPKNFVEPVNVQKHFVDKVNERAKGKLVINFRGGPETFGAFDIPKAVQSGVVDMGMVFVGAVEPVVPGVGATMLTELNLEEERQPGGAYDYVLELYKDNGLYYLGRGFHTGKGFFYTWLREKRVDERGDFAGLSIGGTTAAQPAVKAWGATYTPIPLDESYSAMERGVVDAITAQPPASWKDFKNYEVSKYVIDHAIYAATPMVFMNLDSFNSLPKDLQDIITGTFVEAEKEISKAAAQIMEDAMAWMVANGHIEPIKLSPEDTKWYLDAAYEGAWQHQQENFPEVTPKLKELYSK